MTDTAIGWTNKTWNPVTGCSHVSPGCVNCYAEKLEHRFGRSTLPWTAQNAAHNVKLHPDRLGQPLRWRTPSMVFVNSMSDLFHERVGPEFLDLVFQMMAEATRHTFQVLTKRPRRMHEYVKERLIGLYPLANVWLGTSVEDQRRADERLPWLRETRAEIRFLSCEPLLEAVELDLTGIGWVIVGGESGPGYRPCEPAWIERIAAQCEAARVPLFVKQDSGPRPGKQGRLSDALWEKKEFPVRGPAPQEESAP